MQQRNCAVCKIILNDTNWYNCDRKRRIHRCKKCNYAVVKRFRENNREHLRAYAREYRKQNGERMRRMAQQYEQRKKAHIRALQGARRHAIRAEVLAHLGAQCACCGETQTAFLAIDHINGGGNVHAKKGYLPRLVKKLGFSKILFRILCHNCNHAFGQLGFCPHHPKITTPLPATL